MIARRPSDVGDRIEQAEIELGAKTSLLAFSARLIRGAAMAARLAPAVFSRSRLRLTPSSLSRHLGGAKPDRQPKPNVFFLAGDYNR